MLHQKAGYISARPTSSSQKASCDARPVHTSGSKFALANATRECPIFSKADLSQRFGKRLGLANSRLSSGVKNDGYSPAVYGSLGPESGAWTVETTSGNHRYAGT